MLIQALFKAVGQLPTEATGVNIRDAALKHPDTKFIMAHLGGNCYHGLRMVVDLPNVWSDFSGGFCRASDIPYAVQQLGAERIVFGTDNAYAMNLGQVYDAKLTNEQQEQILWKNTASLFGF